MRKNRTGRIKARVTTTKRPGNTGFPKRYLKQYGRDLVCVRHRLDAERGLRFTTVEIVVGVRSTESRRNLPTLTFERRTNSIVASLNGVKKVIRPSSLMTLCQECHRKLEQFTQLAGCQDLMPRINLLAEGDESKCRLCAGAYPYIR